MNYRNAIRQVPQRRWQLKNAHKAAKPHPLTVEQHDRLLGRTGNSARTAARLAGFI